VAMVAGMPARDQCYKTFFFVTDDESKQTRVFVPGKPFRTCLMFVRKAKSLRLLDPKAPTLLTNIRLGWKSLHGASTLVYLAPLSLTKS
jgi:hypothetical protein